MTDFGLDTSCTTSMHTAVYATGVRLVAEAAFRRLITRKGELLGDEEEREYGFHVGDYLGSCTSPSQLAAAPGLIRAELLKDERITSADVFVTETGTASERAWEIAIDGYTGAGPFELVLAVSAVTIDILRIAP